MRRVIAIAAVLALVPAGVGAAAKSKPRVVKVGDDYFSPTKMTVSKGKTVKWTWLSYNGNTHDVKLKKGPKGVKKFQSDPATTGYSFKKKLTVRGKYTVICTFHQTMRMTITVK